MDTHEREILEIVAPHVEKKFNMYRTPAEQLNNVQRDNCSYIVSQSPYVNTIGFQQWSDFTIYDKNKNVDLRVEVMSLKKVGGLSPRPYELLMEVKNFPEKKTVLVLIGDGFHRRIKKGLKEQIKINKLPVKIVNSIDEFKKYINKQFI